MENRDKTPVGEISPKPYFWGPFDKFQAISQSGFSSDDWLLHCENYYRAMRDATPAARYLAWSVFRTRAIGRLVGVAFGVLMRPLALLESKKSLFDASSAVYFLGRKTDGKRLSHKELVALYDGQFPPVDG